MLRQAVGKDLSGLKKLIDYGSSQGYILPRSRRELKENLDLFFVFEKNGKIVGCCALDVYNWKQAEIRSLVVLPGYRKKGIGTRLIKKCLAKAKKLRIYKVLSVTKKDKFFETLGFAKCLNDQWAMFIKVTKRKGYI